MQILMSESLKGKVELGSLSSQENSLMASFVFKDQQFVEKIIQVGFEKSKSFNVNNLKTIIIELPKDFALIKKFLSKDKLLQIDIPDLEYSYKIEGSFTYLINNSNNYGSTLSIEMEREHV